MVLAVAVLALAGCADMPRYAEGAGCAAALFAGVHIGLPVAIVCGLHEVHKEIAAEKADVPTPKAKRRAKPTPPPPEPEADEEDDEPEYDNGNAEFEDDMGGQDV